MTMSALQLVTAVVEELGHEFEYDYLRTVSAETILFDGDRGISEMLLISIVAGLERAASDEFGRRIKLVEDRPFSHLDHPYRTVGSLAAYLESKIVKGR